MKIIHKTYRFISAFTLFLFAGTIVLPAGVAAKSLKCDMEQSQHCDGFLSCCFPENERSHNHNNISGVGKEECSYETACNEITEYKQSELPALPHIVIKLPAVKSSDLIFSQATNKNEPGVFKTEPASFNSSPPLFLLNSIFLN